jgi:hypothetical protein
MFMTGTFQKYCHVCDKHFEHHIGFKHINSKTHQKKLAALENPNSANSSRNSSPNSSRNSSPNSSRNSSPNSSRNSSPVRTKYIQPPTQRSVQYTPSIHEENHSDYQSNASEDIIFDDYEREMFFRDDIDYNEEQFFFR